MALVNYYGTGRRKTSVARVRLVPGEGKVTINGRDMAEYFGLKTLELIVRQPLNLTETVDKYDVIAQVEGGGASGQARGIVLLAAAKNNLTLVERTPLQVQQAVTGYGKATKAQVIYMVTKLLHLPKPPHPDDVADALAIGICTLHCIDSLRWRNKL